MGSIRRCEEVENAQIPCDSRVGWYYRLCHGGTRILTVSNDVYYIGGPFDLHRNKRGAQCGADKQGECLMKPTSFRIRLAAVAFFLVTTPWFAALCGFTAVIIFFLSRFYR